MKQIGLTQLPVTDLKMSPRSIRQPLIIRLSTEEDTMPTWLKNVTFPPGSEEGTFRKDGIVVLPLTC